MARKKKKKGKGKGFSCVDILKSKSLRKKHWGNIHGVVFGD